MRTTLILSISLIALFSSTVLLNGIWGILSPEEIRSTLDVLKENPKLLACVIFTVLAIDSLLAVPTITTVVLAGYFLGPLAGGLVSSLGILMAGSICFWGARFCGMFNIASVQKRAQVTATVGRVGPVPLLLSRAAPMLPEVLSILAGAGGMPAARYYVYFCIGNVPFAFLAAWAGSSSSFEKPWPALLVGVGLPALTALLLIARRLAQRRRGAILFLG